MRLYASPDGRWTGTQADAKKLGKYAEIDVPTDKPGLLAWLNSRAEKPSPTLPPPPVVAEPDDIADLLGEEPAPSPVARDTSASATLSRIDNPDIRVDDVVEAIGKSKMHALKRFAGAVAMRFQELAS